MVKSATAKQIGFRFQPGFKKENTQRFFSCLRKKLAQIIDAQTSPDRWMTKYLRHCYACRHQNIERRLVVTVMACGSNFLWLFSILFLMTLRLYRPILVEIRALFPEILRFEFVTLFMKHPAWMLGNVQQWSRKGSHTYLEIRVHPW